MFCCKRAQGTLPCKYVKEFPATTIPNITSLMVDNVDEDTYELQQRVEAALKVLVKETLVQEHSGNYVS